ATSGTRRERWRAPNCGLWMGDARFSPHRHALPMDEPWKQVAQAQLDMISRGQLRALGIGPNRVRNHLKAGRWTERTSTVISLFTGELTWRQRCWLGVLHAGGEAMVSGLTAAGLQGLRRWERDDARILVRHALTFEPVDGVR